MKLFKKIDTETGVEFAGQIQGAEIPIGQFRIILPNIIDVVNPLDGELARDDDYIYIWNEAISDWKRIGVAVIN
ncbi:MAG TPA: hypothetical protein PLC04_08025 [Candidatus Kapabacteria bacterium]|nr:hypothetical protein [Candidatus Kapabacteria bacterium]